MTSSADDKRWAILPPPSPESATSGEFHLNPRAGQVRVGKSYQAAPQLPERDQLPASAKGRTRGRAAKERRENRQRALTISSIQALEPADSQLVTERPPEAERASPGPRAAMATTPVPETVPALSWADDDES